MIAYSNTETHRPLFSQITFWSLWLFVFFIPLENLVISGVGTTIPRLIGFMIIGAYFFSFMEKRNIRRPTYFHALAYFFIIWVGFSYLWSIRPNATFTRFLTYAQLFGLVWIMWDVCRNSNQIRRLLIAYMLGSLIQSVGLVGTWFFSTTEFTRQAIFAALNANDIASLLVASVPIFWYFAVTTQRLWLQITCGAALSVTIFALVLTASRGGFIGLVIVITLCVFLLTREVSVRNQFLLVVLIAIAAYFTFMNAPDSSLLRLQTIETALRGELEHTRQDVWAYGWETFENNFWVGVGAGAFRDPIYNLVMHNTYLSVLVELGIIGFLNFSMMFLVLIGRLNRLPMVERHLWLIIMVSWGVSALTLTTEYNKSTWILLALLATHIGNTYSDTIPQKQVIRASEDTSQPILISRSAER